MVNRNLPFRARADLQVVCVDYSGQATRVLKDPVSLALFHLTAEEYFLFEQLGQPTSLGQLQRQFEQTFPPRRISIDTLQAYLNQLHGNGLLLSDAPGQARQLLERGARRRRQWWWQSASRLLAIRLPGLDVGPLLDGLLGNRWGPARRRRWSRGILLGVSLLGGLALFILVSHWTLLLTELPTLSRLLEPRYLLPLMGSLVVVKLLHEFAHALACRYWGGRPQEIGVMLLALMPVFYCDVSDAWRFPDKWHRMAVSAAGMAMELGLAALAILLWSVTEPGFLHTGSLNIVLICSFGSLLVNANPLLRYDGYYLLADWLEVPNLSVRGSEWFGHALQGWLLGESAPDDPLLSPSKQRLVVAYALGSRLYLAVVLAGLYLILRALARPYHWGNLINTLALIVLFGFLLPRGIAWAQWWMNPWVRARMRGNRFAWLGMLAAGLMGVLLVWPIQGQVGAPVRLVPEDGAPMVATEEGMLISALPAGTQVEAGDVVAQLANPQLEQELTQMAARVEAARLRWEQLLILRVWDERLSRQLPTAQASLADARAQWAQRQKRADRLLLRAPRAGQVLAAAKVIRQISSQESAHAKELACWSGSLLEPRNHGAWVVSGAHISSVADPDRLEAWVAVSQADVPQVAPNQSVRMVLASIPGQVLMGQVVQVARRATHPAIGPNAARPLAVQDRSYHLVRVRLTAQDTRLWIGARGRAKIGTGATTLAAMFSRYLRATFHLPW